VFLFEPHQSEYCGFMPNVLLDITEVWDKKLAAMQCMRGQEHLWDYYTDVGKRRGVQAKRNSGPNLGLTTDTKGEASLQALDMAGADNLYVDPVHIPTCLFGRHPGWGPPGGTAVDGSTCWSRGSIWTSTGVGPSLTASPRGRGLEARPVCATSTSGAPSTRPWSARGTERHRSPTAAPLAAWYGKHA
jgi:hypothetical protein